MSTLAMTMDNQSIRINRFLSTAGLASRRKAEELVRERKVAVNGTIVTDLATRVDPRRDRVTVEGRPVAAARDDHVYIVLNKPKDTITTVRDERGRRTVMSLLTTKHRVFPIGRLDRNTTGVLLFTDDGELAHHLMHPRFEVPKFYRVTCDRAVDRAHLIQMRKGVRLETGMTAPAHVEVLPGTKGKEVGIVIHEGKNRQVRNMFERLGYTVEKLDRVAYGPITRHGLGRGESRNLTRQEIRALRKLAGIKEPL